MTNPKIQSEQSAILAGWWQTIAAGTGLPSYWVHDDSGEAFNTASEICERFGTPPFMEKRQIPSYCGFIDDPRRNGRAASKEDYRLAIAEREAEISEIQAQIDPLEKRKAKLLDAIMRLGQKSKEAT